MLQDVDTYASAFINIHMVYSDKHIVSWVMLKNPAQTNRVRKDICGAENLASG